jgi:hypothetical protein
VVAQVHQVGAALVLLGRVHERVAAAPVRVWRGRHRRGEKARKQEDDDGGGERHFELFERARVYCVVVLV